MHIDFVGPSNFDEIYRPVMEGLAGEGHDLRRFPVVPRYRDEAEPASLDILVGIGPFRVDGSFMDRAPRLRALVSPVIGTDVFDEAAASARTVLVANAQMPESYISMAEAAVLLILAALYDLPRAQRILADSAPRPHPLPGRMLMNKTVGLIGFGQIAQAVAARLEPWGCRMVATVRTPRVLPAHVESVPLDTLLAGADVVVVLTELNGQTRGMLGLDRLRLMKPDVAFINVSRGGIAPDAALVELARERPEMRLALDVFDVEPLPKESALRALPGAILTPHMVGHTRESHALFPVVLLETLRRVMKGVAPQYVRNPAILPSWRAKWAGG